MILKTKYCVICLVINALLDESWPRLVVKVLAAEADERRGDVPLTVLAYPGVGLLQELLQTSPGLVQEQRPAGTLEESPEQVHSSQ